MELPEMATASSAAADSHGPASISHTELLRPPSESVAGPGRDSMAEASCFLETRNRKSFYSTQVAFMRTLHADKTTKSQFAHCSECPYNACVAKKDGVDGGVDIKRLYAKEGGTAHMSDYQYVRQLVHLVFEDPAFNRVAKIINSVIVFSIILATFSIMLSTVPEYSNADDVWNGIEYFVISVFTLEYLVRLWATKSFIEYHKNAWNIVDIVAILPFYVELSFPDLEITVLTVLRAIRLIRLFKILKIPSLQTYTEILFLTLKKSFPFLSLLAYFIFIAIIIVSSPLHEVEHGTEQTSGPLAGEFVRDDIPTLSDEITTPFPSIPASFWWAVQTMTAVGYGDAEPLSVAGKILTMITCISGFLVLSLPISIIGTFFYESFHSVHSRGQSLPKLLATVAHIEADLNKRFKAINGLIEANVVQAKENERLVLAGKSKAAPAPKKGGIRIISKMFSLLGKSKARLNVPSMDDEDDRTCSAPASGRQNSKATPRSASPNPVRQRMVLPSHSIASSPTKHKSSEIKRSQTMRVVSKDGDAGLSSTIKRSQTQLSRAPWVIQEHSEDGEGGGSHNNLSRANSSIARDLSRDNSMAMAGRSPMYSPRGRRRRSNSRVSRKAKLLYDARVDIEKACFYRFMQVPMSMICVQLRSLRRYADIYLMAEEMAQREELQYQPEYSVQYRTLENLDVQKIVRPHPSHSSRLDYTHVPEWDVERRPSFIGENEAALLRTYDAYSFEDLDASSDRTRRLCENAEDSNGDDAEALGPGQKGVESKTKEKREEGVHVHGSASAGPERVGQPLGGEGEQQTQSKSVKKNKVLPFPQPAVKPPSPKQVRDRPGEIGEAKAGLELDREKEELQLATLPGIVGAKTTTPKLSEFSASPPPTHEKGEG
jgi:voltage-gated potassium channel